MRCPGSRHIEGEYQPGRGFFKGHDRRASRQLEGAMKGIDNLRGKVHFQINHTLTGGTNPISRDQSGRTGGSVCPALFFPCGHGQGQGAGPAITGTAGCLLKEIDMSEASRRCGSRSPAHRSTQVAKPGKRRSGGCLAGELIFVSRKGKVCPWDIFH